MHFNLSKAKMILKAKKDQKILKETRKILTDK